MKLPISATIVARNEEKKIGKCLSSLAGVVDEIIFVHDGPCSDATLERAKKFMAKLFVEKFVGEAEPHRKFAWRHASHDWVLQIDADEYLTPNLVKVLPGLIKKEGVSGYKFKWNIAPKGEKKFYDYKLALYKKSDIMNFYGIPHETVSLKGKVITVTTAELGHDRDAFTSEKFQHKLTVWPKVQGEFVAKYKYKCIPAIVLPFGYVLYPLYVVLVRLVRGHTRSFKSVVYDVVYAVRFWRAFCYYRLK